MILDNRFNMGGQEKKLYELLSRIDTDHYRPVVCSLKNGSFFKDHFVGLDLPFYEGLLHHKYDVLAYRRLLPILARERIDLLYTFPDPNNLFFGSWARRSGRVKKLLVSFHSTRGDDGGRLLKGYQLRLLRAADAITAVAHLHKRYLVEVEGVPGDKITVIHNGVDTTRYSPGPRDAGLAAELGIADDEIVVTTVAGLKPEKCIDKLLEAARIVSDRVPKTRWLLVGDGPERERLIRMAAGLGIGGNVTFTGIREDIPDILRLCNLFVLPSQPGPETCPNVVLEAMAAGLPVVSTDVGSIWELVFDGESGYVVPPRDVPALAEAMLGLVCDTEKAHAFGVKGRAIVERSFTIEQMCGKREALFARLLCESPAP